MTSPIRIQGQVKLSNWGAGRNSLVASLGGNNIVGKGHAAEKGYAELWVGTHPSHPAKLPDCGSQNLRHYLSEHAQAYFSQATQRRFGSELPFLFKILSIAEPLSIQAHPDAAQAKALFAKNSLHYPDPHPKPEVGVALHETSLLLGFRNLTDLAEAISSSALRLELEQLFEQGLALFRAGHSEEKVLAAYYEALYSPANTKLEDMSRDMICLAEAGKLSSKEDLLCSALCSLYPGDDPGPWNVYLLQHILLQPGEAVFIDANTPHAYLAGEIAECMAPSDNVVRAGLTPKFVDAETLLNILTFQHLEVSRLRPGKGACDEFPELALPDQDFFAFGYIFGDTLPNIACCTKNTVQLLFCSKGEAEVFSQKGRHLIQAGSALLLPANWGDYILRPSAGAHVFRARSICEME